MISQKMLTGNAKILSIALLVMTLSMIISPFYPENLARLVSHIPAIVVVIGFLWFLVREKQMKKNDFIFLVFLLPICFTILLYSGHSYYSAFFFAYLFVILVATPALMSNFRIDQDVIPNLFLLIYVAAVLFLLLGFTWRGGAPLPIIGEKFRINISPPGSTVHVGVSVAGLALVILVYRIYIDRERRRFFFFLLILAVTAVVFSYSRSSIIGVLAALSIIVFRRIVYKSTYSLLALVLAFIGLYAFFVLQTEKSSEVLVELSPGGAIEDVLRLSQHDTRYGLASGREQLWEYHLYLFENNPLGAGMESVRQLVKGDVVATGVMRAGGEQFYTSLLGAYGYFSIILLGLILLPLFRLAYGGKGLGFVIYTYFVVFTFGAQVMSPPLSEVYFLMCAAAFAGANTERRKKTQVFGKRLAMAP